MKSEAQLKFIESWGSMGVLWGINRSMARIQAYILLSEDPVDLDTISEELDISRGNASMCLKELRNLGLIHKVNISGDRRDFYKTEPDMWKMLFIIVNERKKREFDPALNSIREILTSQELSTSKTLSLRMQEIETIFSTFDRFGNSFLKDESKSRTILDFFNNFFPK